MKKKLEQHKWICTKGNHEATGSRYANMDGGWDCYKHSPYLQK